MVQHNMQICTRKQMFERSVEGITECLIIEWWHHNLMFDVAHCLTMLAACFLRAENEYLLDNG